MYEQRGIETVQVIPSLRGMLLAHQGWRGRGSAAVRDMCALIEQRSADSEVAVHIFSNNGFVFFGSCLQASPLIRERISAVILDSAPSYITPDSGATALLAAVRRVEADKAAAGLRWSLLRTAMVPVMALMDGRQSAAWGAWSSHCPRAPHLFIFSKRDKMVPPADIEAFAEEHALRVRALGRAVEVDKWETGQHCGLLRVSKTRYMQAVVRFLQDSAWERQTEREREREKREKRESESERCNGALPASTHVVAHILYIVVSES